MIILLKGILSTLRDTLSNSPARNLRSPSDSLPSGTSPFGTMPARPARWSLRVDKIPFNALTIAFLIFMFAGCTIFRGHHTTDDSLLDFYATEPPAHTKASLRLTEKARSEISPTSYTTAIDTLNKALSIDPQNPFAYYFLAYIYHQKDDYKKSNGFLEKAKQLFSNFPFWKAKSYELSSLNFEKLGDKQKSNAQLKKAKEIYPNL